MHTSACPVCGQSSAWPSLAFFEGAPRTGVFLERPDMPMPCHDLRFAYCPGCALVRRCPDNYAEPDYRTVNRRSADQLPRYTQDLAQQARNHAPAEALVIDVGGNDGTFGRLLAQAGFSRILNVEPSESLAAYSQAHGCPSLCTPLTQASAAHIYTTHGPATVVFARHVVEHVAAPLEFLAAIAALVDKGGWLCLETPNVAVLLGCYAHELWEEHLYYFSPQTITALLQQAGFHVHGVTLHPHRGSQNMVLWAQRSTTSCVPSSLRADPEELERCASFMARWKQGCACLHQGLALPAPVYALGASHPQLNFLHFSDLACRIDVLIDDDPEKTGRYVRLPQAVPIQNSQQASQSFARGGTLLMTAWGCDGWMHAMEKLALQKGLTVIHPYQHITFRG